MLKLKCILIDFFIVSKCKSLKLSPDDNLQTFLDQASGSYHFEFWVTDPELDEEERVVRPFFIQLLQASFLLRKLVVNLPHVYWFQYRVAVSWVWWAHVYKKVLILQEERRKMRRLRELGNKWISLVFFWWLFFFKVCTVSLSLWISIKAQYSRSRSFAEAIVLSCHTGAAIAAGRWGGRGS